MTHANGGGDMDEDAFAPLKNRVKILDAEIADLKKERDELKGLLSNDTAEWKSAAFQKIKTLEALLKDMAGALERYMGKFGNCGNTYDQAKEVLTRYHNINNRKD